MTKPNFHFSIKRIITSKKLLAISVTLLSVLTIGGVSLAYRFTQPSIGQPMSEQSAPNPNTLSDLKKTSSEQAPTQSTTTNKKDSSDPTPLSTSSSNTPSTAITPGNQKATTQPPSRPIRTESPPVPPNPYCPAPRFDLSVTRAPDSYNLYINVIPDYINPSNTPECGGVGYDTPVVTYPTNGNLCSGIIYPTSYMSWGMACSIYSTATYGTYTYTFTVKGFNGFNISTTRTVTYTINYQQE